MSFSDIIILIGWGVIFVGAFCVAIGIFENIREEKEIRRELERRVEELTKKGERDGSREKEI